jgi:hypothetical protein
LPPTVKVPGAAVSAAKAASSSVIPTTRAASRLAPLSSAS